MDNTLKQRFEKVFKGKRLLAIHLNGFSHSVIFDSGTKDSDIEQVHYSGYMSRSEKDNYNMNKLEDIFSGISHYQYQNNAKEIIYVYPDER